MNEKEFFYKLGTMIYKIDNIYDNLAKKADIPQTLLWILYALNDGNKHSQCDICKNWSLPKSTVNTIIKDLESKNIVVLEPVEGKRREMFIKLTNMGIKLANEKLEFVYSFEKDIFQKLLKKSNTILNYFELITNTLNEEFNKNEQKN